MPTPAPAISPDMRAPQLSQPRKLVALTPLDIAWVVFAKLVCMKLLRFAFNPVNSLTTSPTPQSETKQNTGLEFDRNSGYRVRSMQTIDTELCVAFFYVGTYRWKQTKASQQLLIIPS